MQYYRFLCLATLCAGTIAFAQTQPDDDSLIPPEPAKPGDKGFVRPPAAQPKENIIDEATLRRNPQLLARLLDQAVMTGETDLVTALLPLYEEIKEKDEQLLRYARAAVARHEGRNKDAIRLYRDMLADNSELPPVRLQLALALAADRQDRAAEDQFTRLRSDELPPAIHGVIDQEITKLQERRAWTFNFSAYYQSDDNINDAPSVQKIVLNTEEECRRKIAQAIAQGITNYYCPRETTYPSPIKAKGIHYYLSTDKTFPLNGGLYAGINGNISGDQWDKSDYNDLRITAGTTLGWRDTRRDVHIDPFIRRRIYSGDAYSTSFGANLGGDYWVTTNWRLSANGLLSHTKHDKRESLDGNQYYGGISALYVPTAGRYFFGGAGMYRNETDDPSDTYNRPSVNLGWGEEWSHGISTRLTGSIGKRQYAAADFFNIKRMDDEYSANFSVWKRDWHLWGITPKLTVEWNKTDSNHFYYDNKNDTTAYLEFSKTF